MLHATAMPKAIPVQFDEAGILAEFPAATPALAKLVAELRMTTAFLGSTEKTMAADIRVRLQERLREVSALIENFPTSTVADIGLKADARGVRDSERSFVPQRWTATDAELTTAASDLVRIDAAINALPDSLDREFQTLPEYAPLDTARTALLLTLSTTRAEGLRGLQAKAKALLADAFEVHADNAAEFGEIGLSLARDLLDAHQGKIAPQADPIFAAIDKAKRLFTVWDAAGKLPLPGGGIDPHPEFTAGSNAFHGFVEETLLKTVPRTGEGCAALARYASEHYARWGHVVDENDHGDAHLRVLDLIARSPLLPVSLHPGTAQPLPTPGSSDACRHPDAALLELGQRYSVLRPAYYEAARRLDEASGDRAFAAAEKHYDRVSRELSPVEVAIADATAHTLDGLAIKARCVWAETRNDGRPDDTLLSGLIRDVQTVTGQPLPVSADDGRPVDEDRDLIDPPESKGLINPFAAVDGLDVAGLSTDVLIALNGVAETLAEVAGDTLNRGFCHKAGEHTAAGTFAFWVQEACGRVIDNAHDEAFQRLPTATEDKGARRNLLEMVARRAVQSNDPALVLTFVRALNVETPAHA